MQIKAGQIAIVTGGGDGMGRALCAQLISRGVHVATCDINEQHLKETAEECSQMASQSARIFTFLCDLRSEAQCLAFRDAVVAEFGTKHVNMLFNNAGVGGGGSFVKGDRKEWEMCFDVNWHGVYYMCRAFMDLLLASTEGCVANTSSVNALWASLGPETPHTSYGTAKFAVRGFTEALINDFKVNAPHLQAVSVMPGFVSTGIAENSSRMQRLTRGEDPAAELTKHEKMMSKLFRTAKIALTPAEAATIILSHVEDGRWRCLLGDDAEAIDAGVRAMPEAIYDMGFEKIAKAGNPNYRPGQKKQLERIRSRM